MNLRQYVGLTGEMEEKPELTAVKIELRKNWAERSLLSLRAF